LRRTLPRFVHRSSKDELFKRTFEPLMRIELTYFPLPGGMLYRKFQCSQFPTQQRTFEPLMRIELTYFPLPGGMLYRKFQCSQFPTHKELLSR
jgi:hypothetical protein